MPKLTDQEKVYALLKDLRAALRYVKGKKEVVLNPDDHHRLCKYETLGAVSYVQGVAFVFGRNIRVEEGVETFEVRDEPKSYSQGVTATPKTVLHDICTMVDRLTPDGNITVPNELLRQVGLNPFMVEHKFTYADRVLENIIGSSYRLGYRVNPEKGEVTFYCLPEHQIGKVRTYTSPDRLARMENKAAED